MALNLPINATPKGMRNVVRAVIRGSKDKSALRQSDQIERTSTLNRTLKYGIKLGFLEYDGDNYTVTDLGRDLAFQDWSDNYPEDVNSTFDTAFWSYAPYVSLLEQVLERNLVKEVNGSMCVVKEDLAELIADGEELKQRHERAAITFIRTLSAAGYGKYVRGRRGSPTRMSLTEEKHQALKMSVSEEDISSSQGEEEAVTEQSEEGIELSGVDSDADVTVNIEISSEDWSRQDIEEFLQTVSGN